MKKRVFNVLNFLALNVLFFALYLNFIHKDTNTLPAVSASAIVAAKSMASVKIKTALPDQQKEKFPKTNMDF